MVFFKDLSQGVGKMCPCQCRRYRKVPWRRKWQPMPVFLPGKSHGQRSLASFSPWDCKESDMTEGRNMH